MVTLRVLLVGQGLVLAGCASRIRDLGGTVVGMLDAGACASPRLAVESVADYIRTREHDLLLSVGNPFILDAELLERPRIAAINYHNSILPDYAGLQATAWAIYNGEREHGISWHLMTAVIDAGAVIVQRRFLLSGTETARSLDARCTIAAIESLEEVLSRVEAGEFGAVEQVIKGRRYYGKNDTVPSGGVLDWALPATQIVQTVRACDAGGQTSSFGQAFVFDQSGRRLTVAKARLASGSGCPGAVIDASGAKLVVACVDSAVELLLHDIVDVPVGTVLPSPGLATGTSIRLQRRSVIEQFTHIADAASWTTAISDGTTSISYGELADRSARLSARLIEAGLRPEDGVAVLLPANGGFVVAALAAMRAGGAYVPLDIGAPLLRLRTMIAEAGVTHLVTSRDRVGEFANSDAVIMVLDDTEPATAAILPEVSVSSCAYRIFTSGTTGNAKAVEITHAALANLIDHCKAALPLGAEDRVAMLASTTFDASVADIWPILAAGGTLLVPPPRLLLDLTGLIHWFDQTRATCGFVPTAVAERIIQMPWPATTSLRVLLTGGDRLRRRPPPGLPFQLINSYGPTENTVASLWSVVEPGDGVPMIGRPIEGVTIRLVGEDGLPVPDGLIGEIVLGGAQVARGYRGRPSLTARKFKAASGVSHEKLYHTGDLAKHGPDGEFEFCGRIDDQVQILGVRVEPGEIETVLKENAVVADVACIPHRIEGAVVGLIAHIVPATSSKEPLVRSAIDNWLQERLPPALLPKQIIFHDELPVTATGKIDRRLLAGQVPERLPQAEASREPVEALWCRLLDLETIPAEASFWDIGGDSLSAIELLLGIEALTQTHMPVGAFLADPTLAGVRRYILQGERPEIICLQPGTAPPVICWYGYSGDLEAYRHLIPALAGRQILGVLPRAFAGKTAPESLESAAAHGLDALRRHGVANPAYFLGYSWAGLLAFEAARQLTIEGKPPAFVGLVGTTPPLQRYSVRARMTRLIRLLPAATVRIASGRQRVGPLRERLRSTLFNVAAPIRSADVSGRAEQNLRLAADYQPLQAVVSNICLFRESAGRGHIGLSGRTQHERDDFGWSYWAGTKVRVHWVDASHATVMQTSSMDIAAVIEGSFGETLRLG